MKKYVWLMFCHLFLLAIPDYASSLRKCVFIPSNPDEKVTQPVVCKHPANCSVVKKCIETCFVLFIDNGTTTDGVPDVRTSSAGCFNHHHCDHNVCNVRSLAVRKGQERLYSCCCTGDLCNKNIVYNATLMQPKYVPPYKPKTIAPVTKAPTPGNGYKELLLYLLPTLFGGLLLLFVTIYLWRKRKLLLQQQNSRAPLLRMNPPPSPPVVSHAIEFYEVISSGQFGCVWRALYDHRIVAVKVIPQAEKASWQAEKEIYCNYQLDHENLLKFVSAEKRLENNVTQYWIITEYHRHGSLADFLRLNTVTMDVMFNLMLSLSNGLSYLHLSDSSTGKPQIAHRDLKSRNVLVKENLTCCVSDFGSACAFDKGVDYEKTKNQVGTKRYMAPEVLEGAIGFCVQSFVCIDLYALALVLWEILSRCELPDHDVGTYLAPYEDMVGNHPTMDAIYQCVVEQEERPAFHPVWRFHPLLKDICETIEESWDTEPDARNSAQLVSMRLKKLMQLPREDEDRDSIEKEDFQTVELTVDF